MSQLLRLLADQALLLAAGTTVLLSLGCGAMLLCKSPVHRQRISELTIAGVLAWMVLALFPLPRLLPDYFAARTMPAETVTESSLYALPTATPETQAAALLPTESEYATDLTFAPLELPQALSVVEDGPGVPSHAPSPSEEMAAAPPHLGPQQATGSQELTAAPWSFDGQKLAGLFAGAYLAGAALCVLWMAAGSLLLLRIRQTAEQPPTWLASHLEILAKQAGIAPPKLILSPLCSRPLTWGVVWSVVVLPRSLCRRENKPQLESVLLHELGHIAQQDAQGNLLLCAALPLLFAHPLYWWLRRESQLAAELVADDWAAWQAGKETYVEELVALARCTGKSSLPLVGVTGLFSSPSLFFRRMQMLLAREKPLSTKPSLFWRLASLSALAGSVALAASLAGVRPAAGQAPPSLGPPTSAPGTTAPPAAPAPAGTTLPSAAAPGTTAPPSVPVAPTTPAPSLAPTAADPAPLELPVPRTGAAPLTPPALPAATPPVALPPPVPSPPYGILPPARYGVVVESKPLDGEEAALLAEIQQLQAKLRDLESKRASKNPHPIQDVTIKTNQVYIVRSDDKGATWLEAWTTDEQGRPSKILSKTEASHRAAVSSDGKTLTEELVNPDGSRVTRIVDAATGKVIGENHLGGKLPRIPTTARAVEQRYPTPILVPQPNVSSSRVVELVQPNPVVVKLPPQANAQLAGAPNGGQQLDLISLATSYADAVSVLEAAEARMADIGRLGDANVVAQQEVVSAKLALSAAQRKEQLLRRIAEVATENAARELETAMQLHKKGLATAAAAGEAQSRLAILKQILGTRASSEEPKKP